jgi:protein arginine kinase
MNSFKGLLKERVWFTESGQEGDVVVSSRVRLARNLVDHPFPEFMNRDVEVAVRDEVISAFAKLPGQSNKLPGQGNFTILYMKDLTPLDRRVLLERNIITQDFSLAENKAVVLSQDESISVMINETDHLRISCIREGLTLSEVYEEVDRLDSLLENELHYSISLRWGYLNSNLTDIGTGMRASLMVHLPALVMTHLIEKALKAITQVGLVVKGFFGEGVSSLGDMYQIANQICLGLSEAEIVENLNSIVTPLINYERKARSELLTRKRDEVEDKVFRAYGILTNCRRIASREAIDLLSNLRLGISLGLIPKVPLEKINALFFLCQKSHVQKILVNSETASEIAEVDVQRAIIIREMLTEGETTGELHDV